MTTHLCLKFLPAARNINISCRSLVTTPFKCINLQAAITLSPWRRHYALSHFKQTPRIRPSKTDNTLKLGAYALLIIPVGAFCLGTWQIYRRGWKLNLIEELREKTSRMPVPLPDDLSRLEDMQYVPVVVRGHFDHTREFLLGPRTNIRSEGKVELALPQDRVGYLVITPFLLADREETILVNRGWVTSRLKDPKLRKSGQIEGEVELVGCVRLSEQHGYGMAAIAENNTFVWRDIEKMSRYAGTSPVFIDANYESSVDGGPVGGQTRTVLRNHHDSYILTWYSLAVLSGFLWFYGFKRPPLPNITRLHNLYKDQR